MIWDIVCFVSKPKSLVALSFLTVIPIKSSSKIVSFTFPQNLLFYPFLNLDYMLPWTVQRAFIFATKINAVLSNDHKESGP